MDSLKRILYGAGGMICLIVGIVMLFTPGPGVALIIFGLMLLNSARIPFVSSLVEKIKTKLSEWICNNS